ncbi:YkgJ family cysteine cluster protein [Deferribacteraceae bacterium V6Fe1]|nr:YkgJ family cysteine cluster protein [Deferribacteraceae bacterium V6Fe1]
MSKQEIKCFMCGACCVAYDISTLKKPAGTPCEFLCKDGKCGNYENRPKVCRDFKPDEICVLISTLDFEDKVKVIQRIYGISEE